MAIYDKPVRLLMKDMAVSFLLQPGQAFTRQRAIEWFAQHYPKIKRGTVACHLTRLSTNVPTRLHFSPKRGEDDVLFQIDSNHFRLYDAGRDPLPIYEAGPNADEHVGECGSVARLPVADDEKEPSGSAQFAYEADLRNYLAKNLSLIEPGLRLYSDEDITGIEFPVGGRFIDILAVAANGDLVVIELKVSRGYDRVIGQLMRYIGWIQKNQADPGQRVRGIIIAREISEDLVLACSLVPSITLFEYELSMTLKRVETHAN